MLVLGRNPQATMTTATEEEISQIIEAPSSTHPGKTYPVRAIPHSDFKVSHQKPASGTATSFAPAALRRDLIKEDCINVDMPPAEVPETITSVAVDKNL